MLELQALKTKEQRLNVSADMPLRVPAGRMPRYLEEINSNRQRLGLQLIDPRVDLLGTAQATLHEIRQKYGGHLSDEI